MPGHVSMARAFRWQVLVLAPFFALGVAAIGLVIGGAARSSDQTPLALAIGHALLLAGSAAALGVLVGYLFGTPNAAALAAGAPRSVRRALLANTNLEQFSDWVTKMLLGALLASLAFAPSIYRGLLRFVALADLPADGLGGQIGMTVVIYFTLGGFMGGYIWSRTFAGLALDRGELVDQGVLVASRVSIDGDRGPPPRLSLDDLSALNALAATLPEQMRGEAELRAWAKAQLLTEFGDLPLAESVYAQISRQTNDPAVLREYALVLTRRGHTEKAAEIEAQVKARHEKSPTASTSIQEVFNALYDDPPHGFMRAIELGERLASTIQSDRIWAYLGCAYGQKHAYITRRAPASPDSEAARERSLYCIKQAIDLDPSWRATLRSMWHPSAIRPDGDDDLESFYGDPRFAAVLDPEGYAIDQQSQVAAGLKSLGDALSPTTLVKFDGAFGVKLREAGKPDAPTLVVEADPDRGATSEGAALKPEAKVQLKPSTTYKLCAWIDGKPLMSIAAWPLRVSEGETRSEASFEIEPDSSTLGFTPMRATLIAPMSGQSGECSFNFETPAEGMHEVWIEITQARRTIQVVSFVVDVTS